MSVSSTALPPVRIRSHAPESTRIRPVALLVTSPCSFYNHDLENNNNPMVYQELNLGLSTHPAPDQRSGHWVKGVGGDGFGEAREKGFLVDALGPAEGKLLQDPLPV